ncbi:gastrula zinc finger protein XlCGF71.1-like [Mercenaria mercenaria]|uniref:gastrula zinc finger protein XlCGF71.1-like n=1 Tax=Mercenaria mercenaria TaxID=6596 RepID=UPI00234EAE12|nr:gastrula zinc finger protein XlCGF71.1-like [Mercenaria mercenaria]
MTLTHTALDKRFWRSGGTKDIMSETEPLDGSFVDCSLLDGSLLDVSTEETVNTVTDVTEQHLTVNHHQCQICENVYKRKDSLTRHMKIHQEHVFFICSKCTTFFDNETALATHKSQKHADNYLCVQCGKCYSSKQVMERHAATHDDSSKANQCPVCDKTLSDKIRLKAHMNMNQGIKPFACPTCNRKYRCKYEKNRHQLICSGQRKL